MSSSGSSGINNFAGFTPNPVFIKKLDELEKRQAQEREDHAKKLVDDFSAQPPPSFQVQAGNFEDEIKKMVAVATAPFFTPLTIRENNSLVKK